MVGGKKIKILMVQGEKLNFSGAEQSWNIKERPFVNGGRKIKNKEKKKLVKRNPEQFFNHAVDWHELLHSNP